MSFSIEKRTAIKKYMLDKIGDKQDFIKSTQDAFQISLNTVYRYLRELIQENAVTKTENGYVLTAERHFIRLKLKEGKKLQEDRIYKKEILPLIDDLPDNVREMWYYCFTEMMNNVIDHSDADQADMLVSKNHASTSVVIHDNGIGLFRRIREYFNFDDTADAVTELFKGKLTTDSAHHSGEGIFFTSQIADVFLAISENMVFSRNPYEEALSELKDIEKDTAQFVRDVQAFTGMSDTGTTIVIKISNSSNKTCRSIFDQYEDEDGGFTKTRIPLRNIYDLYPVSRSQAKSLSHRFERFEEVILDFTGIPEIGQGFAHELFVVFQNAHPEIRLIPIGESDAVKKMLKHVMPGGETK